MREVGRCFEGVTEGVSEVEGGPPPGLEGTSTGPRLASKQGHTGNHQNQYNYRPKRMMPSSHSFECPHKWIVVCEFDAPPPGHQAVSLLRLCLTISFIP
jgi:hypothetical protein